MRDEALRDAEFNLEKAVELSDKEDPEGVCFDGIGVSYEALGDFTDQRKCEFYEKESNRSRVNSFNKRGIAHRLRHHDSAAADSC